MQIFRKPHRPVRPLDWAWLRGVRSEWGVHPKPSARGLTMIDIAVGSYGEVPEHPAHRSMAPRGADIDPNRPDMGYVLNNKSGRVGCQRP